MSDGLDDYAMPAMLAERGLKDIHMGVINHQPERAKEGARQLLEQATELYGWVMKWDAQKHK